MSSRPLRVDLAAAEANPASDIHNTDNDPQRLLKLSHSLRYQLAQPLQRGQDAATLPGALRKPSQATSQQQSSSRDQSHPDAPHLRQSPPLPPLDGPGTKSGPYSGFASKAWLQGEFRQELDELRQHVDEYVSKREQRAFDVERSALKAEIAHLRTRLMDSEAHVVKLRTMLPDEDGEFKTLKAELEELEREADHFCDLYEREAKATSAALEGYRRALDDITEIEIEFERIRQILASMPEPPAPAEGKGQALTGGSRPHAPIPRGPISNGSTANGPHAGGASPGTPQRVPPGSPGPVEPARACCGCFRIKKRRPPPPVPNVWG